MQPTRLDRRAIVSLRAAAIVAAVLFAAPGFAQQAGGDAASLFTCPDEATLDPRPDPSREIPKVKEARPSAGAATPSPDLYTHARFADLAYDLYGEFVDGTDPAAVFAHPDLKLVGLIYGEPGRDTERGLRGKRENRTLFGFVADGTGGQRYIVFRGTQEPAEWVRNVQVGQRPYPSDARRRHAKANVHAGFYKIFESLQYEAGESKTPFGDALPGIIQQDREAVFVGHSLGSALATLAAVDASRRTPSMAGRLRVVTLASPRVGDAGFAALAANVGRIDRICNLVDIVPAVPPSTKRIKYFHVGAVQRISSYDWPTLVNDLEKAGDQILCWHGHHAYAAMLDPGHTERTPAQCFRAP